MSRPELHERYFDVNAAAIAVETEVLRISRERKLTAGEVVRILVGVMTRWTELVVRGERHPGDETGKKADEA